MTEVLWSAVLATLIFLPILFRSLFSPLSFKRTQNDSVSVSPSIRHSPVKWHKIPNCSVFHWLWKLFVQMLRVKRDDCLQCAVTRGWHADNRFCCGVIAARWGVSLPSGGPRARRRHLVPLSTSDSRLLELCADDRGQYWVTVILTSPPSLQLFHLVRANSYPDEAGRGPGGGRRQINYTFSINVLMTNCCVFCR